MTEANDKGEGDSISSATKILDDYNARIAASANRSTSSQSSHGQVESDIPTGVEHNNGERKSVDRFQDAFVKARAINTIKDIGHSEARSRARVDYNERLSNRLQGSARRSGNFSDDYEGKIQRKIAQGASQSDLSDSQTSPESSLRSFESKVQQKLESASGSGGSAPSRKAGAHRKDSNEPLDEYEAKIRKKAEQRSSQGSNSVGSSLASFQSRIQRKLEGDAPGGNRSQGKDSQERLEEFRARIHRKSTGSGREDPGASAGGSSSSSSSRYEAKLREKLAKANGDKDEEKDDDASLSPFELKPTQKLAEKEKTNGAKDGGRTGEQDGGSNETSSSFESKLKLKLAEKKRADSGGG
jgi:hypothetical protein